MSLLTATELSAKMNDAGWLSSTEMTWQQDRLEKLANAIESAIIAKLAAGVNVEPVAWYMLAVDEDGEDEHLFSTYPRSFFQRLYTANAIAAARVQALSEAAEKATDAVAFNGGGVQMEAHVRQAIRALIGKEST